MQQLTQRQTDLLILLKDEDGCYCMDELMSPFWDQSGSESLKPDIIAECAELGLVECEAANDDDLVTLTPAGIVVANSLSSRAASPEEKP